jgi:polysaccharide chain length determinant protein (PEP-CTERM system associated)
MLGHRSMEVADYIEIFRRRRVILFTCAIVFPAIAVGITRFLHPRYLSQTLVLIEQQRVPGEYVTPVVDSNLDSRLSSMKEQMQSRSRIQPIIERYGLYANEHMTMDDRVTAARKAIDIKPIHSSISNAGGLPGFYITFTAEDAHTAQLVCGEITNAFLNENQHTHEAAAEGTTDFLKSQLEEAKRNLDQQDQKLADFQRKNPYEQPGASNGNVQMLTSLNSEFEAATQQLSQMEQAKSYAEAQLAQMLQQQQQYARDRALAAGPGVSDTQDPVYQRQERELQALQARESDLLLQYTPSYPDVIVVRRQIAELKKQMVAPSSNGRAGGSASATVTIPDSPAVQQLRSQIRAADIGIAEKRREQASMRANIGAYQQRISATPAVEEEYKELTRDYGTAQKFYDDLNTKMNHAKEAAALDKRMEGEQFKMMDEPNLPEAPSFPNVQEFAAVGLVFGLGLGGGIAALLEYRDTSLRNERDVWAFTRLPTLGIISVAGIMPAEPHSPKPSLFARLFKRNRPVPTDGSSLANARG